MIGQFGDAIGAKAGTLFADVVASEVKSHLESRDTEITPSGLLESEIDAISRRVRRKLAEIERAERVGSGALNWLAATTGCALGFALLWSVMNPAGGTRS